LLPQMQHQLLTALGSFGFFQNWLGCYSFKGTSLNIDRHGPPTLCWLPVT